jgi:hypothetical protein
MVAHQACEFAAGGPGVRLQAYDQVKGAQRLGTTVKQVAQQNQATPATGPAVGGI